MPITKRKRIAIKRAIALFVLFSILNQLIAPEMAFALTAGPTAPEATNFEPIDTTDMVNPLTGDFTYGLPLLEVPGPEGGYPLALSYHADIQPNEDASWVGTGWSLNPGAIARNVNGNPDDWKGITSSERDFWNGGHTETFNVDVGYGFGSTSVSAGLSFSQDTYRGFGVGADVGVGEKFGKIFSAGVKIGISPYGDKYLAANIGVTSGEIGNTGLELNEGLGLATNFKSVDFSGSASLNFGPIMESISTSNLHPSLTIGGGSVSSVNNPTAGKISSKSHGFTLPIPIWTTGAFLSLGYKYTRYWSDETSGDLMNGVLNDRSSITDDIYNSGVISLNHSSDDNYHLLDPVNNNIVDQPNASKQLGGTFPEFDNYSVSGQGIGGNMRPYIFSSVLYTQNIFNISDESQNVFGQPLAVPQSFNNKKWQFRFINDFSNYYGQTSPYNPDTDGTEGYNFDSSPTYGNNDGTYGYDPNTNRLEGSNHIEYFTNDEIADPSLTSKAHLRGFIDCQAGGFNRATTAAGYPDLGSQVGGFMITNSSGVTYHYALPAYSSRELVHTESLNSDDGCRWNELHKNAPYAYTWFLTAITGQDYVDRGAAGPDQDDWGYWVKFDYGLWSDNYAWRNPSQGMQRDINNQFQTFSTGVKDVYYLDAIETRSHTALFVKQLRQDAQSVSTTATASAAVSADHQCLLTPGNGSFDMSSVPSLDLSYILLLKNDQFSSSINSIRLTSSYPDSRTNLTYGNRIIDVSDIAGLSENLNQKCLRKMQFNYDYSLCPGVPNSFSPGTATNSTNLGKLTLLSVDLQGKGGTPVTPPIRFQYDLDPGETGNRDFISIVSAPANVPGANQYGQIIVQDQGIFNPGDILSFVISGLTYYCTLISTNDGSNFKVLFLNNSPASTSTNLLAIRTKNPPYNKDAYDGWNTYKSDYIPDPDNNENLARLTSGISNNSADVWSLRGITSSIGANIKINYEGDTYNRSALSNNKALICSYAVRNGLQNYTFFINAQNLDLNTTSHVGDHVDIVYMIENGDGCVSTKSSESYAQRPVITNVTSNQITVSVSPEMEQDIWQENTTWKHNSNNYANIQTANMSANGSKLAYGGGIRVKDLIVDDLNGHIKSTSYSYKMPGGQNDNTNTSGVTSYEPTIFDADNTAQLQNGYVGDHCGDIQTPYRKELYRQHNKLLAIAREIPGPGVEYEYVTVSDNIILPDKQIPVEGKTVYQFEVFKPEMIGIEEYYYQAPTTVNRTITIAGNPFLITYQARRNMAIKDYTSRIGNLKRMITYDNLGNKIAEKINHYLYDDIENTSFNNQVAQYESRLSAYHNIGIVKERYGNARISAGAATKDGNISYPKDFSDLIVMSGKETFPSVQTGTTQIDYKNGTTTDQTNLAFDFYTGAVTKTLTKDSYGNRFVSQATPAYTAGNDGTMTNIAYPALGLKTFDDDPQYQGIQHKQMLTQQASNYTFTVDGGNNPIGVVTASTQTWSASNTILDPDGTTTTTGQSNIWRVNSDYNWLPSGTSANNVQPYSTFADFYGTVNGGSSNPAWKKTYQVTKYNVYSASLEATDINNKYSATRMGYNNSRVLFTGGPANYNDLAYAGVEDPLLSTGRFSNNISPGDGILVNDSTKSHTGMKSLLVPPSGNGFNYTLTNTSVKNYSVSVWVKSSTLNINQTNLFYQINNGTVITPAQTYAKSAAGWFLLEATVPASALTSGGTLLVGCRNGSSDASVYFDDFRFQPTAATTTAYVYDNQTGAINYILGNNNLFVRFQYDEIGRLVRTYKEVLGKAIIPIGRAINYNYAHVVYHNVAISQIFFSQSCGTGIPQPFVYTVAANTYSSNISQADASNQALNDLNTVGRNLANTTGGCLATINFTLSNSTNSGYKVNFSNSSGNFTYDFSDNGFKNITIPVGIYEVDIYPTGTYVVHTITLGARPSVSAPRKNFDNVNVNTGSTDLNITVY